MSESAKIRPVVLPLLEGKTVLDIGCGLEKIVPWAVGVDDASENVHAKPDIAESASPLNRDMCFQFPDGYKFDVVFSSHTLEHIPSPILETLRYWLRFVKVGGLLVLYLPSEARYQFDPANPKLRNPAHHHYLEETSFRWYLDQIQNLVVERYEPHGYSFLVVARKGA